MQKCFPNIKHFPNVNFNFTVPIQWHVKFSCAVLTQWNMAFSKCKKQKPHKPQIFRNKWFHNSNNFFFNLKHIFPHLAIGSKMQWFFSIASSAVWAQPGCQDHKHRRLLIISLCKTQHLGISLGIRFITCFERWRLELKRVLYAWMSTPKHQARLGCGHPLMCATAFLPN